MACNGGMNAEFGLFDGRGGSGRNGMCFEELCKTFVTQINFFLGMEPFPDLTMVLIALPRYILTKMRPCRKISRQSE